MWGTTISIYKFYGEFSKIFESANMLNFDLQGIHIYQIRFVLFFVYIGRRIARGASCSKCPTLSCSIWEMP